MTPEIIQIQSKPMTNTHYNSKWQWGGKEGEDLIPITTAGYHTSNKQSEYSSTHEVRTVKCIYLFMK